MKKIKPIFLLSLLIVCVSCKKEDVAADTDNYNLNPAEHNYLIKSSRIFGNRSEKTVFKQMISTADGNAYYNLYNENNATSFNVVVGSNGVPISSNSASNIANYEIGKIQSDGTKIWNKYAGFSVHKINTLPFNSGKLKDALVAVGYNGKNGFISVYAEDGQKICDKAVSQTHKSVWFNSVQVMRYDVNYTYFTALGGLNDTLSRIVYPYLANFRLNNSTLTLTVESENGFTALPQEHFVNFERTNEIGTPFIATTNNEGYSKIGVFKIATNYNILWQRYLEMPNAKNYVHLQSKIIWDNQKIYLSATTEDNDKGTPDNGGKWHSGLLTCLEASGTVFWQKKINLSKYSEFATDCLRWGNFILLMGSHSRYCNTQDKKCGLNFGNGLISKIDISSGNIVANYTFGEKNTSSAIYGAAVVNNSKLVLGGYTNWIDTKETYQGWFFSLNLSDL